MKAKKRILAVLIASTLNLTGCELDISTEDDESPSANLDYAVQVDLTLPEPQNRWDSVVAMTMEKSLSWEEFSSVSFDIKADKGQSFWVYLRDEQNNDIAAHYDTYAQTDWQNLRLIKSDFNITESDYIKSVHFFIGSQADSDDIADNRFYIDNIVVTGPEGEYQGERGEIDEDGTGWYDFGFGNLVSVFEREETQEEVTAEQTVSYDIEYTRTSGDDYYVSPTGDDQNDGMSVDNPFMSIDKALAQIGAGDKLILMPGEYTAGAHESVIKLTESGTADNWISIEAQEKGTVTLNVPGYHGVLLEGASYVRVKGLTIKGIADTLTVEEAIALKEQDWYSEGLYGVGIGTESRKLDDDTYVYPHHIILEDNHVSWMSGGCIGIKRADYIVIRENLAHNCGYYNVWAQSGISVWENHNFDDQAVYRTIIENNVSHSNYNHFKFEASSSPDIADSYTDGNGIIIDALAIDQGYLNDNTSGIYSGKTLVQNNVVYNNGGKGINLYASDNVDVIHNTSYKNGQHPEISGEMGLGDVENIRVINNIIVADGDNEVFFYYYTSNLDIQNNIIYKESGLQPSDKAELSVSFFDSDPMFVNPSEANFMVESDSVAVDNAINTLTTKSSKNGVMRPQGSSADLGAYEQ